MPAQNVTIDLRADGDATIALGGIVELPAALLGTLAAGDATKAGIKLADQRVIASVIDTDGKLVKYTLSVYAQREPLTDAEKLACQAVADGQDKRKADKLAADEAAQNARVANATKISRDALLDGLRNAAAFQTALGATR